MSTIFKFISDQFRKVTLLTVQNKKKAAALLTLLIVLYFGLKDSKTAEPVAVVTSPQVTVRTVAEMVDDRFVTSVGAVEAVSEVRLQTESGGRVTSVNAKIGDTISAGTVLATLENASERAALLQAEGAYEAALAASAQSDVGTREAQIGLQNALAEVARVNSAAYGTAQDVLISTVDTFYSDPNGAYPGVRITTTVSSEYLRNERTKLQSTLKDWSAYIPSGQVDVALYSHADFTKQQIVAILNLVDVFRTALNDTKNKDRYTESEEATLNANLTNARADLVAAQNSIETAISALRGAVEGVERAEISATGGNASAADAQIKQALGVYRAAQANYEKTIVRSSIGGVVNALYLKTGDYVSPSTPAGIVANSNGLEIRTSINQEDAVKLALGDSVTLDGEATGTISAIAGAIDPTTGKVAVTIFVNKGETVKYGTTVSVRFSLSTETTNSEIAIPLSAIKMTGSGPVVFSVDKDSKLVASSVTLGPVSGETVLITEGVTLDSKIVVDARGLKAGEEVTVGTK